MKKTKSKIKKINKVKSSTAKIGKKIFKVFFLDVRKYPKEKLISYMDV